MNNLNKILLSGHQKIRAEHVRLLAYIYIRQSTVKQVMQNRESQENQYQLVQLAQNLGWPTERIRVIDADLGMSGASSLYREGFQELVAEISLGRVGIVFGYEVSRLARNNSDWYHLLDLASVFNTLIADIDGIYDPRLYNDRLLLGLKGTMSEAELHLLRQRLEAGRMSQVKRGEFRQRLPTGLRRLAEGVVVKDPDDQVRHAIEMIFEKFEELGSCQKVLRYFVENEILVPRYQNDGAHKGEMFWKPASQAVMYEVVRNPAYAGAFVYGRRQANPTKRKPGRPTTGMDHKRVEDWLHIQQNVYPAYITWEQYLTNQEKLHQNAMNYQVVNPSRGSARKGNALLQGLAVCGICGCRMHINYPASAAKSHRYDCDAMQKRCEKRTCMSLQGTVIDEAVTQAFFEAIRPAQINALEVLLAEQDREHQLLTRQWEERLKRIQYEIQLAQRQYYNVDPENRLVAAELEHRWEQKLQDYQQVQSDYQLFRIKHSPHELSPALREQFAHISETLPGLWPRLPNEHKKELLKSLISQVILKRIRPDQLEIRIVWVSGHCSLKQAHPPIHRMEDVSRYKEMVARIHDLWEDGLSDNNIAELMTEEGFRTARTNYMTADQVTRIREKQGWFSRFIKMRRKEEIDGYLTVKGLAKKVGISRNLLYRWIMAGIVDEKYMRRDPQGNFRMIQNAPELIEQLQQKKSASHVYKKDV